MSDRVVITGIGILCGFGVGKAIFWDRLLAGDSALRLVDKWAAELEHPVIIATIPEFSAKDVLPKLRPPHPSRYCQLALFATSLALKDARLDLQMMSPSRIGTVLNTDYGPNEMVEQYLTALFLRGPATASPLLFSRTVGNVAIGDVARYFQLKGPSTMLFGEHSLCYAYDLLQDDRADVILCGGLDELRPSILWSYEQLGLVLSHDAYTVVEATRPYHRGSVGMALGEAAAILVLERLDHALGHGATIYAEVLGYATGADALSNYALPTRDSGSILRTMEQAVRAADAATLPIELVIGAASSHWPHGEAELRACAELGRDSPPGVIGIKGAIGETFGSSGSMGTATGALFLHTGQVPSRYMEPDTRWPSVNRMLGGRPYRSGARCLCNSIHLGGNNSSVLLSSWSRTD